MSNSPYEKLLEALDLHQNLLFAEQQAISARDLNTVEQILNQKDSSMDLKKLRKSVLNNLVKHHSDKEADSDYWSM